MATTDSVAVVSPSLDTPSLVLLLTCRTQTAITELLGKASGIVGAVLICIVVAGSLLGNSFVASRMTVAAARRGWLPSVLAVIGRVGKAKTANPSDDGDENAKSSSDAPINSIILSAILATFYILLGNFRALLTLNGLGEYSFFFLAVLGALVLRYREPDLARPYRAFIAFPLLFVVVSGFVVIRGAIFAPLQAMVIISIWILGLVFYWVRRRWFT